MIEGGCLCGKVRYRIDGQITDVSHCHCAMCRKAHGAAFGTYGAVQQDQFHWTDGQDLIKTFSSSADMDRTFCSNCGSHLMAEWIDKPGVIIRLGCLDDDPGARPKMHIWRSEGACWYDPGEQIPQHSEGRPRQ